MMRALPLLLAGLIHIHAAKAEEKSGKCDCELPAFARQFDTDGDGKLSESERDAAKAAFQAKRAAEGKDGKTQEQFREERLKKFDTNGDGKLDEDEKKAAMAQMREEKGEGDGKYRDEMVKRFDTNGDGRLDEDEKRAAVAQMKERKNASGNDEHKRDFRQGRSKGEGARGKGAE